MIANPLQLKEWNYPLYPNANVHKRTKDEEQYEMGFQDGDEYEFIFLWNSFKVR